MAVAAVATGAATVLASSWVNLANLVLVRNDQKIFFVMGSFLGWYKLFLEGGELLGQPGQLSLSKK